MGKLPTLRGWISRKIAMGSILNTHAFWKSLSPFVYRENKKLFLLLPVSRINASNFARRSELLWWKSAFHLRNRRANEYESPEDTISE